VLYYADMEKNQLSRRHFFYGALLAGAIPAAGFGSTPSLGRLGWKSPNEKLNLAAIGAGGRAETNIAGVESENIVAFADPDSQRAANMFSWYPDIPKYKDYRVMLDKEDKDIDAVVITIPDHMHGVAAMACMERGKHVYLEKPLTRTIWEARKLVEAAKKYGVATQMGNQGYSSDGERVTSEIIWSGEIGNVTEVHAWTDRPIWPQGITSLPPEEKVPDTLDWDLWLGCAETRPFSTAYVPFNWRGWYDFGCGALGDIACHVLGGPNMGLRLGAPTSIEGIKKEGENQYTFPMAEVVRFDFPARGSMPPLKIFWYSAAKGPMYRPPGISEDEQLIPDMNLAGMTTTSKKAPARTAAAGSPMSRTATTSRIRDTNGCIYVGDKGYMSASNYGETYQLLPAERMKDFQPPPQLLTRSPGHYRDWIRACKGGDPACSNFSVSGPFSELVLLGVIATRVDGKLEWDSARMRFTNNEEANKYLVPAFRKGWGMA